MAKCTVCIAVSIADVLDSMEGFRDVGCSCDLVRCFYLFTRIACSHAGNVALPLVILSANVTDMRTYSSTIQALITAH